MSEYVPYSRADYAGDGEETNFAVPFQYIDREHVVLLVNQEEATFTWLNDGIIIADEAPPAPTGSRPQNVRVQRRTPNGAMITVFSSPSNFQSSQLNAAFQQALFVVQEAFDAAEEGFTIATELETALNEVTVMRDLIVSLHEDIEAIEADLMATYQDVVELYDSTVVAMNAALDALNDTETARDQGIAARDATVAARDAGIAARDITLTARDVTTAARDAAVTARGVAESARDEAEAAWDSFEATYLGTKASDPSVNNQGGALVTGNFYFNATTSRFRVYGVSGNWSDGVVPSEDAGDLLSTNNLSDVADAGDAFDNIKQAASNTATGVVKVSTEASTVAGTATDEVVRVSDAADVYSPIKRTRNTQTGTSYTLQLTDAGGLITLDNGSAITLTVPPNSSVAFPVDTQIDLAALGAGQVTVAQGAGVTINSEDSKKKLNKRYSGGTLIKTATDTWLLVGSLAA